MRYLIDTSALIRVMRRQVSEDRREQIRRGLVAICEPVLCEAMTIVSAKDYPLVEQDLRETYPWAPVPDDVWSRIRAMRAELAQASAHQGLSVADYLVAATSLKLKLTVLHEDGDYETVGRVIDGFSEERISTSS